MRSVMDRARGHGDEPAARPSMPFARCCISCATKALRCDRRLRHRLFVVDALEALSDRLRSRSTSRSSPISSPIRRTRRSRKRSSASPAASGSRSSPKGWARANSSNSSTFAAATASRDSGRASRWRPTPFTSSCARRQIKQGQRLIRVRLQLLDVARQSVARASNWSLTLINFHYLISSSSSIHAAMACAASSHCGSSISMWPDAGTRTGSTP